LFGLSCTAGALVLLSNGYVGCYGSAMEALIVHYGYWILLPAAIIEGPLVTVFAAFLASLGYLNIYYVYGIAVLGDVIGDVGYYAVGRLWGERLLHSYGHKIGITKHKLVQVRQTYFEKQQSLWKIITLSKITQAPTAIILLLSGMLRVQFRQFLLVTTVNNLIKAVVLVGIGYFFGVSHSFISTYLKDSWVMLIPTALFLVYVFYIRKSEPD